MKSYTNNVYIEIDDKEFEIEITVSIENDSIGKHEFQGHVGYDKQEDYLGQIIGWQVQGEVTAEDQRHIEKYIYDNEGELIEGLSDKWLDN